MMNAPRDWKQQLLEPRIIGPEPPMNPDGFWKKPKPAKLKFEGEKEDRARSDK